SPNSAGPGRPSRPGPSSRYRGTSDLREVEVHDEGCSLLDLHALGLRLVPVLSSNDLQWVVLDVQPQCVLTVLVGLECVGRDRRVDLDCRAGQRTRRTAHRTGDLAP